MDKENASYLFICISNNNINNWTFYIPIQHMKNKLFPYYRFIHQMKANLWFKCQIKRTRYFTIFPICLNYFILPLLQLLVEFKANGENKNPLIKEHIFWSWVQWHENLPCFKPIWFSIFIPLHNRTLDLLFNIFITSSIT